MGAVGHKCFLAISGTAARSERRRALGFHRKEPAPLGNAQKRLFYFHVYHLEAGSAADALIEPRTEPPRKTTNGRRQLTKRRFRKVKNSSVVCRRICFYVFFVCFLLARQATAFRFLHSASVDTLFR